MHVYTTENRSLLFPSVTYILEKTLPARAAIMWKKRKEKFIAEHGIEQWDKNTNEGRHRGSAIHKILEKCHTPKEAYELFGHDELVLPYLDAAAEIDTGKGGHYELPVYSQTFNYGGTIDRLNADGILYDFKTFKGYPNKFTGEIVHTWNIWKKSMGDKANRRYLPQHISNRSWEWVSDRAREPFLQLALYRLACIEMGISVKEIRLIVISPYGYQEILMPASIWKGCCTEAIDRVRDFWKRLGEKWLAESSHYKRFGYQVQMDYSLFPPDRNTEVVDFIKVGNQWKSTPSEKSSTEATLPF